MLSLHSVQVDFDRTMTNLHLLYFHTKSNIVRSNAETLVINHCFWVSVWVSSLFVSNSALVYVLLNALTFLKELRAGFVKK